MGNKLKMLFVAGGTGGHILPAVSFGYWIEEMKLPAEIIYLCGNRMLEQKIYNALNIEPITLSLSGSPFGVKGLHSFIRWKELTFSLVKIRNIVRNIKPDLIVLFGGYLSVPFALMTSLLRVPMIAHEQNAVAGKSTRLCSRKGMLIITGWEECINLGKSEFRYVGIPVRKFNIIKKQKAWEMLGGDGVLPPKKRFSLVMGGSIGGESLKHAVTEVAKRESLKNHIFMLLGPEGKHGIRWISDNVIVLPQAWDLSAHFSLADYVVTRCGASTLSELICYHVPSVLVPWEEASDNHQLANAELFLRSGIGTVWQERNGLNLLEEAILEVSDKCRSGIDQNMCDEKRNDICARFWNVVSSFSTKGEGPIGFF